MPSPLEALDAGVAGRAAKLVLFDVDGTLTAARKQAAPEVLQFLKDLRKRVKIGMVGGSDLKKQQEQLDPEVGSRERMREREDAGCERERMRERMRERDDARCEREMRERDDAKCERGCERGMRERRWQRVARKDRVLCSQRAL